MIEGLRLQRLLAGYRGRAAATAPRSSAPRSRLAQFYLDHRSASPISRSIR